MSLQHIKEPVTQRTLSGIEHGLMKVVANSVPDNEFKRFKEKDRPAMQKLKADQCKMKKVIYINTKGRKDPYERPYCKWDGDPILSYKFLPEHEYEVPQGLIDEVNALRVNKRSGLLDAFERPILKDEVEPSEHRFISSQF
jgi:hypothetical protein